MTSVGRGATSSQATLQIPPLSRHDPLLDRSHPSSDAGRSSPSWEKDQNRTGKASCKLFRPLALVWLPKRTTPKSTSNFYPEVNFRCKPFISSLALFKSRLQTLAPIGSPGAKPSVVQCSLSPFVALASTSVNTSRALQSMTSVSKMTVPVIDRHQRSLAVALPVCTV